MKLLKVVILPALLLGLFYLIFFQSQFLTLSLNKNNSVPLGTVISWLFIVVFVFIFFLNTSFKTSSWSEKILHHILVADLILSFFWGVISFLLAGNWTFIFENKNRFDLWVGGTLIILLLPVFILSARFIIKLFGRK